MQSLSLPQPALEEVAFSQQLEQLICNEIGRQGGAIPFDRYMEMALYAPGLGYYTAGMRKLGPQGDFVTAPEISALFSRTLAYQVKQVLDLCGGGDVLEFGAGSGRLAVDMLRELEALDALPERYLILELSPDLRQRQQQLVAEEIPHLGERMQWLERLPQQRLRGVVVANEVMDAMPVHRFRVSSGNREMMQEQMITCVAGQLEKEWWPASAVLQQEIAKLGVDLPSACESEINLRLKPWIAAISDVLEQGAVLLIDYGYTRSEYFHPQRSEGTLLCHFRQHAHGDALFYPGLQDITAHVDFTAVAEAADDADLNVSGYTNQAGFLLACGIERLLQSAAADQNAAWFQQTGGLKRLVLPSEMGERFKVMALTRNIDEPLMGFSMKNMLHQL
ncbi:MAG: SAM-dependent methyltransferase [Gammaproteobacteria bacterium]|nr:SAM-dependent methyltransferase [Gammaproteobacteria bacterium]